MSVWLRGNHVAWGCDGAVDGQSETKAGALKSIRCRHTESSVVCFGDATAYGEAYSGAFFCRFGGEEAVEEEVWCPCCAEVH